MSFDSPVLALLRSERIKKPATENYRGWLVLIKRTDVFAAGMQATGRGCTLLNKNATDMGTSVALAILNQKFWLNCCAETRP